MTPEQVRLFRQHEGLWEGMYPVKWCGIHLERFWQWVDNDEAERRRFWLGPGTRPWVEAHLQSGQVGLSVVERVTGHAHVIVALESRGDEGVYVCDPLYGHRIDTWDWFLSIGTGQHGCHRIDGWYRKELSLE